MPHLFTNALLAGVIALAPLPAAAAELVMVEQVGCAYCELWHKQVGHIYPVAAVSDAAPLRTVQLSEIKDAGFEITRPVVFTPTFLLVDDGQELARLEGYAGEDFFWPLVEKMVAEHAGFPLSDTASGSGS
ncbi:hypothetical protein [Donghicola sp. XS_ASV15]|uniref:hypothetical protein n=1 Tax=Donghicola sp. XS_ASV15 TaxID=3241295 RepID=UPI0035146AA5